MHLKGIFDKNQLFIEELLKVCITKEYNFLEFFMIQYFFLIYLRLVSISRLEMNQ